AAATRGEGVSANRLTGAQNSIGFDSGVLQRQSVPPPPAPNSAVGRIMEALSRVSPIAGVGDCPEAFRILDSLTVDQLLTTLTDLESRSQLDLLIANSPAAAAFNQARLVTAMQVVRKSIGAAVDLPAANAALTASTLPAGDKAVMRDFIR